MKKVMFIKCSFSIKYVNHDGVTFIVENVFSSNAHYQSQESYRRDKILSDMLIYLNQRDERLMRRYQNWVIRGRKQ